MVTTPALLMARRYVMNRWKRAVGAMTVVLSRLGLGNFIVLTTTGCRSGLPRRVPVSPISLGSERYLVSPYGVVPWVRNVRAQPRASYSRTGVETPVRLVEVTGSLPELVQAYYEREPVARRYMDVPPPRDLDAFAAAADRFPVFRMEEQG